MTTIVADFRTKTMVSDTRCSYGSTHFRMQKIHQMPDGTLIGFSGSVNEATKFVEWFKAGANKGIPPVFGEEPFDALTMNGDGIYLWDSSLMGTKIFQDFFAVGSGAQYALGALKAGATPDRAVEIATEEDSMSGLPLDVRAYLPVDKKPSRKPPVRKAKKAS